MNRVGQWTDEEVGRGSKRLPMLIRRGIPEDRAWVMLDVCCERDADKDTRHYCAECKHLQQDGGCFMHKRGLLPLTAERFQPVKDVLMRCPLFAWQVPT